MKTIVIYNSRTGFTKQYAQWIAQELQCDSVSFQRVDEISLGDFDTIIFGSWCHAGRIKKLNWVFEELKKDANKNYVVFAVGASPMNSPDAQKTMEQNIPKNSIVKSFYLQGGLNYEKMTLSSRIMMKLFSSMIKKKKDATDEQKKMAEMMSRSYDSSDKKFIVPLLRYVHSLK
ncbi:MAG: flavodoxin domain-containing protein [Acutalibacteraceae bacterium]